LRSRHDQLASICRRTVDAWRDSSSASSRHSKFSFDASCCPSPVQSVTLSFLRPTCRSLFAKLAHQFPYSPAQKSTDCRRGNFEDVGYFAVTKTLGTQVQTLPLLQRQPFYGLVQLGELLEL